MRDLRVPEWAGPVAWVDEIQRQQRVIGCKASTPLRARYVATARLLTPWRVRSAVQCTPAQVEIVLPMLEHCRRDPGRRLLGIWRAWSDDELGELLVEARNRLTLAALGRDRARPKGPRFDPRKLPGSVLDALIQRHADLRVVEALRGERNRRLANIDAFRTQSGPASNAFDPHRSGCGDA